MSRAAVLAIVAALVVVAPDARAQRRPSEEPLPVPGYLTPEPEPKLRLPPIPPTARRAPDASGERTQIREIRVQGATAFSEDELRALAAPYVGRAVSAEEIAALREAITRAYVDRGYATSFALVPAQRVDDGVLELRVVEGRLTSVNVEGAKRLRAGVVRRRIEWGTGTPLDVRALQNSLDLLQQDPLVERVHARLVPGAQPGESVLHVALEEAPPTHATLVASNDHSPSVGAEGGEIDVTQLSPLGLGDQLTASFEATRGLYEWEAAYALPVHPSGTEVGFRVWRSGSEVVEDPFDALDIENESVTYGVHLRQPLLRAPGRELDVRLIGERRRSKSYLFGDPFSFVPGLDDGLAELSVLRFAQDFTLRQSDRVLALRSMLSAGTTLFSVTEREPGMPNDVPDARFYAWLGQIQFARRLSERWRGTQVLLRGDAQIAFDPLLPLEQFSIGGMHTVRGYRENTLVRDNGLSGSLELRVPLVRTRLGADVLQLAPFFDIGRAWNHDNNQGIRTLPSAGVGLRYLSSRFEAAVYWGAKLRNIDDPDDDLQDHGIYFEARLFAF